jgi:cytochrome d ubiquinol oxidase subunit II
LQNDFRIRALSAALVVGILALVVFLLARIHAPNILRGIAHSPWAWALHGSTALAATGAIVALWRRSYRWARFCAVSQVTLILVGWALAQYPYLVYPDVTIHQAAAPQITLRLLLGALIGGAIVLFPSYFYLFRVFKRSTNSQGTNIQE